MKFKELNIGQVGVDKFGNYFLKVKENSTLDEYGHFIKYNSIIICEKPTKPEYKIFLQGLGELKFLEENYNITFVKELKFTEDK